MALSDGDKAQLIALELIRRSLGGLPDEFARVYAEHVAASESTPDKPQQRNARPSKMDSLDVNAANNANRAAAQSWPKVVALVNGLVAMITRRDSSLKGAFTTGSAARKRRGPNPFNRLRGPVRRDATSIRGKLGELRKTLGAKSLSAMRTAGRGAARGAKAAGGKAKGGIEAVLTPFTIKLFAILGPMALLAATLSSATSGFQLVGTSVKLLGNALGPILLPFLFMLATGIATLADIIWGKLAPGMEDWFTLIISKGIDVIETTVSVFNTLVDVVGWCIDALKDFWGMLYENRTLEEVAPGTLSGGDPAGWDRGEGGAGGWDDEPTAFASEAAEAAGAAIGAATATARDGPSVRDLIGGNMRDMLKEMQLSMGPKAQFQGLAQVSKNAQLAALNESPFEARMLSRMQEVMGALTRVVDNTTRGPAGRFDPAATGGAR